MANILHTNVLIIGAGPAGSACAIRLSKLGIDCILVDRKAFPRTKLCSGLLTSKGNQTLRALIGCNDLENLFTETVTSREDLFRFYDGASNLLVECRSTVPFSLLDRPRFDHWMVNHFKKLGRGAFYDNTSVQSIDFDNHIAVFPSYDIKYDYLIAADGANSTVERMLGNTYLDFSRRTPGIVVFEVNIKKEDLNIDGINMYYNIVPGTCAWVFAKGNTASIGFGLTEYVKLELDAHDVMVKFLNDLGARNIDRYSIKSAILNCDFTKKHAYNNVLFVGEAAGLVDPLTGEGISFALKSGLEAANAIVIDKNNVDDAYEYRLRDINELLIEGAKRQKSLFGNSIILQYYIKSVHNYPNFVTSFVNSYMQCEFGSIS